MGEGPEILVRQVQPSDKEALRKAFERLSPESRYRRFFAPLRRLTDADLRYLTEVDHHGHEALLAISTADDSVVGVARYVRVDPPEHAEVAVVVADDWHGRGVASGLLVRLVGRAREAGVTHFRALVMSDNVDALGLFDGLADSAPERRTTSEGHVELLIEVPADEPLRDTALGATLREAATGEHRITPWSVIRRAIEHNRQDR